MGSPVVLRIPAGGPETVTAIFSMGGELVRVDDGHVYAKDIGFFDAWRWCPITSIRSIRTTARRCLAGTAAIQGSTVHGRRGCNGVKFALSDRDTLSAEQL